MTARLLTTSLLRLVCLAVAIGSGSVAVAPAGDRDRPVTAVYGEGWILGIRAPEGWQTACCEKAQGYGANLILWRGALPVGNGFGVMRVAVWAKDGGRLEDEWRRNQSEFKAAFPTVQFKPLEAPSGKYRTLSAVFHVPGQYSDFVTFVEPGESARHRFTVALSSKKPLTDAELAAYRSVVRLAEGKL